MSSPFKHLSYLSSRWVSGGYQIHADPYGIWAMVNTHYMVDGHPIHNKDPLLMVIINPYEPLDD